MGREAVSVGAAFTVQGIPEVQDSPPRPIPDLASLTSDTHSNVQPPLAVTEDNDYKVEKFEPRPVLSTRQTALDIWFAPLRRCSYTSQPLYSSCCRFIQHYQFWHGRGRFY